MKKLVFLLLSISLLLACKKDDSDVKDHKRLKQITMSNDALTGVIKVFFNYENNMLVDRTVMLKSNTSYNTWDTTVKCDYTYSGDFVTAISYFGDGGKLQLGEKAEYDFTENRMDRMKYYEFTNGQFISRYEYFFNFNGELLESFNYFCDTVGNGQLYECSKGEFTYDGKNIIRFRVKDLYFDAYFYNEDFTWENGLLDNWVSSENYRLTNTWKNIDREEYEYNSDNLLEKITFYNWHFYWSYIYSVSMQYAQGKLVTEDFSDYTDGLKIEYLYEDGIGNSDQLLFSPIDRIYNNPIIENRYNGSLNTSYNFNSKSSK